MKLPKKIRWVLAHEPIELFLRTAERFSKEIEEKTHGQLAIEVMTLSQYGAKYNGGKKVTKSDLLGLMNSDQIEMSQMYTTTLGKFSKDFHVLDLPFLFRDHDHASDVLDGEIGLSLFADLAESSNIRGLAFTYSGGFRMIAATRPIRNVADMHGLRIRTAHSAVAEDTFRAVGAIPFPMELEEINGALKDGQVEGGESTYPRFYSMKQNEVSTVINDTRHSLFLTSVVASKSFWNSLSEEFQEMMIESARNSAQVERQESVADIEAIRAKCAGDGIQVIELSSSEQNKFRTATQCVYEKYSDYFSEDLIQKIQKA